MRIFLFKFLCSKCFQKMRLTVNCCFLFFFSGVSTQHEFNEFHQPDPLVGDGVSQMAKLLDPKTKNDAWKPSKCLLQRWKKSENVGFVD